MRPVLARAVLLLAAVSAACSTIPSHLTRLWPEGTSGTPVLGLSTEGGVVILADPAYKVGDLFDVHFPVGNSFVREWGRIDRINEDLAVVVPLTARLMQGRLAASVPEPNETLYLAMRDDEDEPIMVDVRRWGDGHLGDYVAVGGLDPDRVARDYAGTGLYVQRDDRWEIVGILAGFTARREGGDPADAGLAYIGLPEIARILPEQVRFYEKDVRPLRPDFEFGVPLQPGDIDVSPSPEVEEPAPGQR